MRELVLSYSRISTWKTNHFDHYMRYVKDIVPQGERAPLMRGHMIHELLEAYNNGKSWKKAWKKQKEEFDRDPSLVFVMGDLPYMVYELMDNWVHYYGDVEADRISLANELEFNLPLCKGTDHKGRKTQIYLRGFIDSVFMEEDDVFIRDYKTYARPKPYDFFLNNYQSAVYQWALPQLAFPKAKGMEWDVITAKTPSKPKMNKNGTLSVAKLASTPYTVRKGIRELGLDPKDYKEFINQHNYNEFLQRHFIRRNKKSIDFMMADIIQSAKQICSYQHEFKDFNIDTTYPSDYKPLWQAEMVGGDIDFLLRSQYKEREEQPSGKEKEEKKRSRKSKRNRPRRH